MKKIVVRVSFALLLAATTVGGVASANANTNSHTNAPQATKQWCC